MKNKMNAPEKALNLNKQDPITSVAQQTHGSSRPRALQRYGTFLSVWRHHADYSPNAFQERGSSYPGKRASADVSKGRNRGEARIFSSPIPLYRDRSERQPRSVCSYTTLSSTLCRDRETLPKESSCNHAVDHTWTSARTARPNYDQATETQVREEEIGLVQRIRLNALRHASTHPSSNFLPHTIVMEHGHTTLAVTEGTFT